jgi:hypothetical protein
MEELVAKVAALAVAGASAGLLILAKTATDALQKWVRSQVLERAIERAGGEAYRWMLDHGIQPVGPGKEQAVARAADYLFDTVGDSLKAAGVVDPDAIKQIARAQLGKLLAADGSVFLPTQDGPSLDISAAVFEPGSFVTNPGATVTGPVPVHPEGQFRFVDGFKP